MSLLTFLAQIEIDPGQIDVPQPASPESGVETALTWVFIIIVAVATIAVIVAGINYMTSRGDPQKTANAKNTIIYAVVGVVVAALATSIIRFIARSVS